MYQNLRFLQLHFAGCYEGSCALAVYIAALIPHTTVTSTVIYRVCESIRHQVVSVLAAVSACSPD